MRSFVAWGTTVVSLVVLSTGVVAGCNTAELETGRGSSSGSSARADGGGTTLRVGNFNTRNLFNDKKDSNTQLAETVVSTADYQKHLQGIAATLKELDAEVVVLIEVENQAVLDDLVDRPEIAGKYAYSALLPGNDPRGINIALVSSLPIDSTSSHAEDAIEGDLPGKKYRYARDVPEFHLSKNGRSFTLLGVHFKAFDPNASAAVTKVDDDKRLAEARGARALADRLLADKSNGPVLLLGDFNADTGSASTQVVRGANPTFGDAIGDRAEGDRWTVSYGGSKMTYDDQWASPALALGRVASSVTLLRVEVSDHAAVAATYTLP